MNPGYSTFAVLWTAFVAVSPALADESLYRREIKPILRERCYACHGGLKQESGLRLDTAALMLAGGDGGPIIEPGDASSSLLLDRLAADDPFERMPPEGEPLTVEQIESIRAWINGGALKPADEQPEPDPDQHWAFLPIQRHAPPPSRAHPIDAFIEEQLAARGLAASEPAPPHVQLRRVYLDLIGVPPTPDELLAFLANDDPRAFERAVDRLLNDPRYGERWGRHWMDVWRYSDWYGRRMVPDVWNSAPQIWRWRDWLVRSLNEDVGYDDMVRAMLAADEFWPDDYRTTVATGYLIRNWYALNPNDWMRSNVEHTGKAFLGLTFNCAHCHDHKYDPISQLDYFRMRAFFEPIGIRQDRVPGQADPGPFQEYDYSTLRKVQRLGAVRIYDKNPDAPTWFYTAGDERHRVAELGSIGPGVPSFLDGWYDGVEPTTMPALFSFPSTRPEIRRTIVAEIDQQLAEAEAAIKVARQTAGTQRDSLVLAWEQSNKELMEAMAAAKATGQPGALNGTQSLLVDAKAGRYLVQHDLRDLKQLPDRATVSFEVLLLSDTHFNFQLAKNHVLGLTAGYVGLVEGRLVSYQPGTFHEFAVGTYSFAEGQRRFHVRLELDQSSDQCRLSIRCQNDGQLLVDRQPVALNGWNPVTNPEQALTFDVRTGSVVLLDDIKLLPPRSARVPFFGFGQPLIHFDFESPRWRAGDRLLPTDGWVASKFAQAPARAQVSNSGAHSELVPVAVAERVARARIEAVDLAIESAAAQRDAARAKRDALNGRFAAEDQWLHADDSQLALDALTTWWALDRDARLAAARATEWSSRLQLAQAETADESQPGIDVQSVSDQLVAALSAQEAIRAAPPPADLATTFKAMGPSYPRTSTGRRRALANWIVDERNPLAARVAANHIWTRHFHRPLVATVNNFGRSGTPPSHPRLLDWLASELMQNGWSMKHLHRLIVTSDVYRRTATDDVAHTSIDPDNRWYWRMNSGRMEAEVLRDSLLYVSDQLDLQIGGQELENSEALSSYRRSLYYSCQPEADGSSELGRLFDAANPGECYRRTTSIVPQQALALTNSSLLHELSSRLAALIELDAPEPWVNDARFVDHAFLRILARRPTAAEREACEEFLSAQTDLFAALSTSESVARARSGLVRVLLNHNDFITIR